MSVNRTNLDADETASAAARLALRAEELKAATNDPIREIRSLHEAEPWGHDQYGNQFRESYLGAGEGENAVESILGSAEAICDTTYELGENAGLAAITSRLVDEEDGAQFARAVDGLEGLITDARAAGQELAG